MTLVDQWRRYAAIGSTIACPEMTLDARDWEEPIIRGRGEIRVTSADVFTYTLQGVPDDVGHLLRCMTRQRENPYDPLMRFRLHVVDSHGVTLNGGWTVPKVWPADGDGEWTLTGEIESLAWFIDEPPEQPGTENVYLIPTDHVARLVLARFVRTDGACGDFTPEYRTNVLGTDLVFRLDDAADALTVSVPASEAFPQTFTENWLGEPLRIMFGQLIYPRFVARKNSDRTMLWVRPSPRWHPDSTWIALWNGSDALTDKDGFWRMYGGLLSVIASARDGSGSPNFEANKVTELYEELIQASLGSRWIWALTFASTIEGLVRMIVPRGSRRASADHAAMNELTGYIDAWPGTNDHLKRVAKNAVLRTAETSAIQALRDLREQGVVTADQVRAWDTIRNQVMHGSLVSRYSSEEDDGLLLNLAALTHALTRHITTLPVGPNRYGFSAPEVITARNEGATPRAGCIPGSGLVTRGRNTEQ